MHIRERATLSLILATLSVFLPALLWTAVVIADRRDPSGNKDQGGSFFCCTPVALIGAVACGLPAILLAVKGATGFGGREGWSAWRVIAVVLSGLGLVVAVFGQVVMGVAFG